MPSPPGALPPDLDDHFSTATAIAHGVPRHRLRARDLVSPFHGVRQRKQFLRNEQERAAADTQPYATYRRVRSSVILRARAYASVRPEGSFFCGRTAAVIYGLPVDHPGDIEVAVVAPRRAPRAQGVRGRKVAAHLVSTQLYEGLPLSTPASTWAMLSRDLPEHALIRVGDAIVRVPRDSWGTRRPEQALGTVADLEAAAFIGPRPPATARLRSAFGQVRVGSASPVETDFRLAAAAAGLPQPDLDREVRLPDGRLLGISEFVYTSFRLIVEIEGDHHRTSRAQWNRDIAKYNDYAAAGWEVVRLTSSHVYGPNANGVATVAAALHRRGWRA